MAGSGARVLQLRAVEFARNHGVPLHVRSTFTDADGTWIREDTDMEAPIISGITHTIDEAYVTLTDVPDKPGTAAGIFNAVAAANINVDTIIQNAVTHGDADVTFSVPLDDLPLMTDTIEGLCHDLGLHWRVDDAAAKISLIGAGMKSHPGVAAKMFQVLADLGINVRMIATSPIKVSCVVDRGRVAEAVSALHEAFEAELAEADGAAPMRRPRVAVVGATGAVGPVVLEVLAERGFPASEVTAFASARSAGSRVPFAGGELEVRELTRRARGLRPRALLGRRRDLESVRAGGGRPRVRRRRQVERLPHGPAGAVVVPEVNADAAASHQGIVSNPNCSTIQLVCVLAPLQRRRASRTSRSRPTRRCPAPEPRRSTSCDRNRRAALDGRHSRAGGVPSSDRVQRDSAMRELRGG